MQVRDVFSKTRTHRARRYKVSGVLLGLVGLVLLAFGFLLWFFNVFSANTLIQILLVLVAFVLGLLALLAGLFNLARGFATPTADPLGARFAQTITPILDAGHLLLRNVTRADLMAQPDALLVGLEGVMLFKLIDEAGIFRCEGELWLSRVPGRDFWTWQRNPTREIIQELDALRAYLARKNLQGVPISAVIVFTHPQAEVSVSAPAIPVTTLDHLPAYLQNGYLLGARINEDLLKQTRRALR